MNKDNNKNNNNDNNNNILLTTYMLELSRWQATAHTFRPFGEGVGPFASKLFGPTWRLPSIILSFELWCHTF